INYLQLVLAGLEIQSHKNFEVIIADDGSNKDTVAEIEKFGKTFPYRLTHIWQEDKGFRKNRVLNKAIAAAAADYLIFIDGDCVPHSEFVIEHLNYKDERICLTGRRVNLSERVTNQLTVEKVKDKFLQNYALLIEDGIFGKSFDVEKGFYFRNRILRRFFNMKKRGILGCNFSIHKKDLLNINGFDERYEAPSIGEDSDIQFRLELTGVQIKSLNNIAVQYHLYHKLQERPQKNLDLFQEVKKMRLYFTPFGINQ